MRTKLIYLSSHIITGEFSETVTMCFQHTRSSDATNNTSVSNNKCLKTFASTGKNIHTVFQSIYNYKIDHNQSIYSGERYTKRRPEELSEKYKKINKYRISMIHYQLLLNIVHASKFERTLKINNVITFHSNQFREMLRPAGSSSSGVIRVRKATTSRP